MEIQFQSEPSKRKKGSRSATRMYAPSHGGKRTVAFAPLSEQQRESEQPPEPAAETQQLKRPRSVQQIKPFTRFMLVLCSFIFAGMILFVLTGYERISRANADINTLNVQIEETELNINALNAAIECAVTIDQAQEWAKSHNMQYPSKSQYVRAGAPIPITVGTDPTAGTGSDETAPPESPAEPDVPETPDEGGDQTPEA